MNVGLLGHTAISASSTTTIQKFRRPYEFDWDYENLLPDNPGVHFLLHPCVHHFAQVSNHYFRFAKVRIGNELPWTKKNEKAVKENTFRLFISYSSQDWDVAVRDIVESLENTLNEKGAIADIWVDRNKMRAGGLFIDQMEEGISSSDYLILIVSEE